MGARRQDEHCTRQIKFAVIAGDRTWSGVVLLLSQLAAEAMGPRSVGGAVNRVQQSSSPSFCKLFSRSAVSSVQGHGDKSRAELSQIRGGDKGAMLLC